MVRGARTILLAAVFLPMGGCAGDSFVRPEAFNDGVIRGRAESVAEGGIRVSAAIPSREEVRAVFGVDLLERGVQPVWMEIENDTDRLIYFLRTGMDPEYFSPREIAFVFSESMTDEAGRELVEHIEELDFRDPIKPRSTVSGFVFTNKDRESKFLSVDLLSRGWSTHLALLVPNPDRTLSDDQIQKIYAMIDAATPIRAESASELRALLEKLPCCTTSKDGARGEPLNLVLIGDIEATGPALVRRGFRYTPAAPLYLFGRPQDLSLKKGDTWVAAQPHMLRVWLTDIRYQEKLVWIGQINTPLGGRFASGANDGEQSRIDPNVDAARTDFLQDGFYSQMVAEVGFVKGVGSVSSASPRTTPGGSTYHTDGLRAVMVYVEDPLSLTEIEFFSWERLIDHQRP